jgi:hypothetical protein
MKPKPIIKFCFRNVFRSCKKYKVDVYETLNESMKENNISLFKLIRSRIFQFFNF